MIDISEIKDNIKKWVEDNIGSDFVFRPNQLDSIAYIINNILNEKHETTVIQAPTGSGKSLLCIISAGVLASYYQMKSYILASDLYLWNQYAAAIDKYKLKQFGYLKGSIGNYRCHVNNLDYNIGKCKQNKVSLNVLRDVKGRVSLGYRCADTCLYMKHRFRAEKSPVALLTYQLWLYQMNLVDHSNESDGFRMRDVIFCDECHNIPDIVEKYAQPVIDIVNDRSKIEQIVNYALDNDVNCPFSSDCMRADALHRVLDDSTDIGTGGKVSDYITVSSVMDEYDYFVDCLQISQRYDNRTEVKLDIIRDYNRVLTFIAQIAENCLDKLSGINNNSAMTESLSKEEKKTNLSMFKILTWMHNYSSMLSEFLHASDSAGAEYVVIEENKDRMTGVVTYSMNCVKEDYLCYNFLIKNAKFKVMTSATVGNKNAFMDNIGVKYSENEQKAYFMDIPNVFDFSKSPIYYMPQFKMSYANKAVDFPKIQQVVYRILSSEAYKDKHGMINTGSYENAKILFDNAPIEIRKRLCMYITSKDKADTIQKYKAVKNKVLIGPTLVEGVDLPDDLCRFIIIIKIPYPNISSKTVKAKMNIFPLWYESTTSNTVIQNIGRGVRNEKDYCTTFILDGCFTSLYRNTYEQYPVEIRNRIKVLNG